MSSVLHPWLGEARLVMRRRIGPASLWCALAVSILRVLASSSYALHALAWRPLITAALMAVLTYVLVRHRLADMAEAWRYGWWSALPIDSRVIPRTVIAVAVMAIVAIAVIGALLWWPLLWLSTDHHLLRLAVSACVAGAIAGVMLAAGVVVARPNQDFKKAQRQPSRMSLFALRWLHDKRLPYLLEWQRRLALARWRGGRRSWWLAVLFALLPGMPALQVVGLLLMTLVAAWFIAVLDAAAGMSGAAFQLLAATPLGPGEIVALIGPNGCGKTTLLRTTAGVHRSSRGQIHILGHALGTATVAAKRQLGLAIRPEQLPRLLSGRECLQLFAGARGLPEIPQATLDLAQALALTLELDRCIEQYSLGMRQKLGLLLGLLGEPPLLILDEPFIGLDPRSALTLKHYLHERSNRDGAAALIATHSLDFAQRHATRTILMIDGELRRQWTRQELDALNADPGRSLEQAMAEALS